MLILLHGSVSQIQRAHHAPQLGRLGAGLHPPHGRLTMLNNVGIHWFDHLTDIDFNMPEEARDGTETLAYTHRLNTGFAPRNYKKDLAAISQPLLVIVGTDDEGFYGEKYEPVISQYANAQVELLDGVSHMRSVVDPSVRPVVEAWLEGLDA